MPVNLVRIGERQMICNVPGLILTVTVLFYVYKGKRESGDSVSPRSEAIEGFEDDKKMDYCWKPSHSFCLIDFNKQY